VMTVQIEAAISGIGLIGSIQLIKGRDHFLCLLN
jgi:hypothetical protein